MTTPKRAAILVSGRGANMAALIAAAKRRDYPADIALVLSNRPQAAALGRAQAEGVATAIVDHAEYGKDREAFERGVCVHSARDASRLWRLGAFNVHSYFARD